MPSIDAESKCPKSIKIDFEKVNNALISRAPFLKKCLPLHTELCIFMVTSLILILLFVIVFSIILIFMASSESFTNSCLKAHNDYRYRHKSPFLRIDANIVAFAKERAAHLAKTDIFGHPKDLKGFGENLHYITSYEEYDCAEVVQMWYNEIKDYDFENPLRRSRPTAHFTQVVWKETSHVGCAQEFSERSNKLYTVCNYYQPGNDMSSMKINVIPL